MSGMRRALIAMLQCYREDAEHAQHSPPDTPKTWGAGHTKGHDQARVRTIRLLEQILRGEEPELLFMLGRSSQDDFPPPPSERSRVESFYERWERDGARI